MVAGHLPDLLHRRNTTLAGLGTDAHQIASACAAGQRYVYSNDPASNIRAAR